MPHFSDAVLIAMITTLGPIITVVISHVLAGRKLDHIEASTNSTLSEAKQHISTLEGQIKTLVMELRRRETLDPKPEV